MAWARLLPIPVILLWANVGGSNVAPPTNVTFSCRNFTNVLQWSYNEFKPGLRFRIDILSSSERPKKVWVDPPTLQAEVPYSFVQFSDYMLTVTAVIGQNESAPSPDDSDMITFSYGQNAIVKHKCSVDLPSVNVTVKPDNIVLLRFDHPWTVYRQKMFDGEMSKPAKKKRHGESQLPPEFTYEVVVVHQEEKHFTFYCETEVCEQTLPVDAEQQEHCLKLKGEMMQVLFEGREPYCAPKPPQVFNAVYLYIGVSVLLVVGTVALIIYMVYRKGTKPSNRTPVCMNFNSPMMQQTAQAVPDNVLPVEPTTPTPLLTHTDEEERGDFTCDVLPVHHDSHFRIGVWRDVSDDSDDLEQHKSEVSEYMQGNKMDEDDMFMCNEQSSAYERRSVVVALGPDEETEGYRS